MKFIVVNTRNEKSMLQETGTGRYGNKYHHVRVFGKPAHRDMEVWPANECKVYWIKPKRIIKLLHFFGIETKYLPPQKQISQTLKIKPSGVQGQPDKQHGN